VPLKKAKPLDGLVRDRPPAPPEEAASILSLGPRRGVDRDRRVFGRLAAGFKPVASDDDFETLRFVPQL
jgi:hypothetical protein